MKLRRVKIQAYSVNAYVRTIRVICNNYPCAFAYLWASLGALNHGCCLVVFTPGNLKFCAFAIRFFTAHGYEFA
ncbi:hypothetical protein JCM6294_1100 [Bacteroides pyogenes DSM 20611 = JCM 6294]|uniref:Uncharacterized protein n=1 Tax=Bacteroides pyogenes DSM 20611 = JCM 6294 TaxID=1121100 RepID=W4PEU1_9BACE|nr:hypothetical protein JCM6294_1100 [Bacteroides pyogenes DSM 20611 = JCM 6294]